jgi:hypothetical protein
MKHMMKRTIYILSFAALGLLLSACPSNSIQVTLTPSAIELSPGESHKFTATVSGAGSPGVRWENTGGTVMGEGTTVTYTAPMAPGTYTLTAVSQADPSRRATATINVVGDVSITLSPSVVRLEPGGTFDFTAMVSGVENQAVQWEASAGEVSGTGMTITYTAPSEVGSYTLTVISQADPKLRATASIEVVENGGGVSITLEPSSVRLTPASTQEFTATIMGLADTSVLWEVTDGSVEGTGSTITYMAPAEEGAYTLTATSKMDPNLSATAFIDVAGGGDGGDDDGDEGGNPTEWCKRVSLAAPSGAPGDRIAIAGLPKSLKTVYANVEIPGESSKGTALIVETDEGGGNGLALLVPLHPTQPLAGGTVNLSISDGQKECAPSSFAISPLANPNSLQTEIADAASAHGIDVATLKGSYASLAPEHASLGMLQFIVDHPDNPNSLVAVQNRGTVIDDGTPVPINMALLNALVYRLNMFDITTASALEATALGIDKLCVGRPALSSATNLNSCMNRGDEIERLAVVNEIVGELIAYAAIIAAFDPVPGDELVFTWLAASQFGYAIGFSVYQQQLPKEITSMTFDVSAPSFNEVGQTGVWQNIKLEVKDTTGINVADLVGELFSNLSAGKILKNLDKITFTDRLFERFVDDVKALVVKNMMGTYKGGTVLPIPYSTYGSVDITEFRASYYPLVAGDHVITVNAAAGSYAPINPLKKGTAQLGLRLNHGYFNNASMQAFQSITVEYEEPHEGEYIGTFTRTSTYESLSSGSWNGMGCGDQNTGTFTNTENSTVVATVSFIMARSAAGKFGLSLDSLQGGSYTSQSKIESKNPRRQSSTNKSFNGSATSYGKIPNEVRYEGPSSSQTSETVCGVSSSESSSGVMSISTYVHQFWDGTASGSNSKVLQDHNYCTENECLSVLSVIKTEWEIVPR